MYISNGVGRKETKTERTSVELAEFWPLLFWSTPLGLFWVLFADQPIRNPPMAI